MIGQAGLYLAIMAEVKPDMVTVIIAFTFSSEATWQTAWQMEEVMSCASILSPGLRTRTR